jgi:hypothetical protein
MKPIRVFRWFALAATSLALVGGAGGSDIPPDPNDWMCPQDLPTQLEIDAWCRANQDRGQPLPDALRNPPPLSDLRAKNAYDIRMGEFLKTFEYVRLGWKRDMSWRFAGPIVFGGEKPESYATHLPMRIYYSPEVIDWLCNGRRGDLPDGAMMI